MKRLREMPASSPLISRAQRLIEAAPPIPDSLERMQQIRRALDQARPRGAALLLRAPAFAVAGALLLFGATAFAAVRIWLEHRVDRSAPAESPSEKIDATLTPPPRAREVAAATPLLAAGTAVAPAQEATQLSAASEPVRSGEPRVGKTNRRLSVGRESGRRAHSLVAQKAKRNARRQTANRSARLAASRAAAVTTSEEAGAESSASAKATPRAMTAGATSSRSAEAASRAAARSTAAEASSRPAAVSEAADSTENADPSRRLRTAKHSSDSELVVRALQTLRREHDPAEAARLLERYRARNPGGVLAEEVLSLQIEAALAGEDPRAHAFAREYLSRYPEGRYRERAGRALAAGAP
jgi:hypothetical protein